MSQMKRYLLDQADDDDAPELLLKELISAVRSIAHGPTSGPTGLEALCIAVSGEGYGDNLAQAIRDAGSAVESGLRAIAEAIDRGTQ